MAVRLFPTFTDRADMLCGIVEVLEAKVPNSDDRACYRAALQIESSVWRRNLTQDAYQKECSLMAFAEVAACRTTSDDESYWGVHQRVRGLGVPVIREALSLMEGGRGGALRRMCLSDSRRVRELRMLLCTPNFLAYIKAHLSVTREEYDAQGTALRPANAVPIPMPMLNTLSVVLKVLATIMCIPTCGICRCRPVRVMLLDGNTLGELFVPHVYEGSHSVEWLCARIADEAWESAPHATKLVLSYGPHGHGDRFVEIITKSGAMVTSWVLSMQNPLGELPRDTTAITVKAV